MEFPVSTAEASTSHLAYGLTQRRHCVAGVEEFEASAVLQAAARLPQAVLFLFVQHRLDLLQWHTS
jgi:hypothetical protein